MKQPVDKMVYLKENIIAEPLIWHWYAWSYLIPPLTAGCNIVNRHIKIMDSFIKSPKIHAQASKNLKLLGGPFLNAPEKAVGIIEKMLADTKNDCDSLIRLSQSYKLFDTKLKEEATGDNLDDFYKILPDELKGCVEVVYNGVDFPQTRLIEPLLYNKYYKTNGQSFVMSEKSNDYRDFVLSTPRILQDEEVNLDIPFNSEKYDYLFSTRTTPRHLNELIELLEVPEEKKEIFAGFYTEVCPNRDPNRNYKGENIRIRYLGHACVLLETKTTSVLIDPVISYNVQSSVSRFTFNDLPDKIDYVLLTHNHQDHVLIEMLLQLRHKIGEIIVPSNNKGSIFDPSLKLILEKIGFKNVRELSEMETVELPDGEIIGLPFLGEHSDINIHSKLAHYVQLKGKRCLFAADSNNLDNFLYKNIFQSIGGIDLLFIGMECSGAPLSWLYGPLTTKSIKSDYNKRRGLSGSNFEKAWALVEESQCKQAYVYAMGQEPWLRYLMALEYTKDSPQIIESNKLISKCLDSGIHAERLFGKKELELK